MNVGRRVSRRFAEMMLFWRGYLHARDIVDFAGVSERTARNLISDWRAIGLLPPYKASAKRRLVPDHDFDPGLHVSDPSTALALLLSAQNLPGCPFPREAIPEGGHDLSLSAAIPIVPIREIVAACMDRAAVNLVYASKTGMQEFVFSPSALVRSRGRYHLRGHRARGRDSHHKPLDDRYVDLVPGRAVEVWRAEREPFIDLKNDEGWNTYDERRFILSSELSDDERLCYEHEYGIADSGVLSVRKRRALMPYVIQELSERRCWRRDGTAVRIWEIADFSRMVSASS